LIARDWKRLFISRAEQDSDYPFCFPVRGSAVSNAGVLSRAQGCLLGQIAGDSLGSLVEFQPPEAIRQCFPEGLRTLLDGGPWNTLAGQPTDDSEMALMLARSMAASGYYDAEAAAVAYVYWYQSQPFDIGLTTVTALRPAAVAHAAGEPAAAAAKLGANRSSQSNGALMRVSPIGVWGAAAGFPSAAEAARQDATLTHPNPLCVEANAVFASTLAYAIAGGHEPSQVYAYAQARAGGELLEVLRSAAGAPPPSYTESQGWVRIAFQNAFYQLLHATTLEEGVVDTVMRGGDTDTNAAIAGALLGAVFGRDSVPWQWRDRILSCRPAAGIPGFSRARPSPLWPVDALHLAERLLLLHPAVRT
jgi:ADP-ribosylglycohydrolase